MATAEHRPDEAPASAPPARRRGTPFWAELPVLVAVALGVAVLIKTFLVQAFYIPSGSMEPALLSGDRVLVNKLAYRFGEPERGDVVVFDSPFDVSHPDESLVRTVVRNVAEALGVGSPASDFIKRIVALPGDRVEIRDGVVLVNGEPVDEPYLASPPTGGSYEEIEVPPGHVFVMGDNRSHSQDSRVFGAVPLEQVVGRAFIRIWPPGRWGFL